MRTLSATLLSAQQAASRVPYVKVAAGNMIGGVVRLDWTRLYSGIEPGGVHAAVMPADGSLIRVRVTPVDSGRILYRQRVAGPGLSSDFSQWTNTGQSGVLAVACCALNAEVSIFWIDGLRKLQRLKSTDYGATWNSIELLDYVPSTTVYGMAVAYKANGDAAVFFADTATLGVKKQVNGIWQSIIYWDKTTGDLSGVTCAYYGDWNLLITGKDTADNYKLWSLIYGDGADVAAGSWSLLKEIAAAPAGENFAYRNPSLDKPDVFRCFYTETFTGEPGGERSFWSHSIPGTSFLSNLCREPVPFNFTGDCGLVLVHAGSYTWLTCPYGVWRAPLSVPDRDLTGDVINVKEELNDTSGKLTIELRNDDGRYAVPESLPDIGCRLELSPGYRTAAGSESSYGPSFMLADYEYTSAGGKAAVILYASDGWAALSLWTARCQFRWNKSANEMSVQQLLEFVLARAGLKLEIKSQSSIITGFYPDFTIHPGNSGETIIKKLLTMVPDILFIEGNCAYLVHPQAADTPVYSYGSGHVILEGRYRCGALTANRWQVEGYDPAAETTVIADTFDWEEIGRVYDRWKSVIDLNIGSVSQARERGTSYLRKAEISAVSGCIRTPVNCGQQLCDVIAVTDSRAGLENVARRVVGIVLHYNRLKGEYEQCLILGGV